MNASSSSRSPLEVWGGVECSRVRLVDRVEDQLSRSGHDERADDLARFAQLGLHAMRYPILWERHTQSPIDWSWADARLGRLRELGIRPIVGFVHHGSGPLPYGLLDVGFAAGLAEFARAFARRYPWVDAYTPINEPLTTARFSGLYGLWHPFGRDPATFARILLNECVAIRAAMEAVREITPHALLIQTEDLGKTHSTPALEYQADFENERRWLTFDLLAGTVRPGDTMHEHLLASGVDSAELSSFVKHPCRPDMFGANYYVTSERFLDERLERYPPECHGGNAHQAYADVPAVRVRAEGLTGLKLLLEEVWHRYHLPIAVTEVQIACTREEQLRWLHEAWQSAVDLRADGIDVRAITAWGLLGAHDWSSLLVEPRGHYEGGVFDGRSNPPRPTALAQALHSLSVTGDFTHAALPGVGWWRRDERLEFPAVSSPRAGQAQLETGSEKFERPARPLLILGATGTLGNALLRLCRHRGLHAIPVARDEFDLTDAAALGVVLRQHRPWAVINAAGFVDIDQAEIDFARCFAVNTLGPARMAGICADYGCGFLSFSSDQVFHGGTNRPYIESDGLAPLNCLGRSQHEAEVRIARINPDALILRGGPLFGPWDEKNFATTTMRRLREGRIIQAAPDVVVSPTYLPDFVNTALDLLIDGEAGVWHAANTGSVSWWEWAESIARRTGQPAGRVVAVSAKALGWKANRPHFSALASERASLSSSWEDALGRFLSHRDLADRGESLSVMKDLSAQEMVLSDGTNG